MNKNILIIGNRGKEFHLYDMYYKNKHSVVAFTSPYKQKRATYSSIPILEEADLEKHINTLHVKEVVFAGSDISFEDLSILQKKIFAHGVDFRLCEVVRLMIKANKKSFALTHVAPHDTSPEIIHFFAQLAQQKKMTWIQHSEKYMEECSNVEKQENQDIFLEHNHKIITGDNWKEMLATAEKFTDIYFVCPDGNDMPLIKPDLYICVWDIAKAHHYTMYYPGRIHIEFADIIWIKNNTDVSDSKIEIEIRKWNIKAKIVKNKEELLESVNIQDLFWLHS